MRLPLSLFIVTVPVSVILKKDVPASSKELVDFDDFLNNVAESITDNDGTIEEAVSIAVEAFMSNAVEAQQGDRIDLSFLFRTYNH